MADQLFKNRKLAREKRESIKKKLLSETWLYVCEGSKTEPSYVKSLIEYANSKTQTTKLRYEIKGDGKNTVSLIKSVDDLLSEIDIMNIRSNIPYGKVFVLFDRDSFGKDSFDNAIDMAEARGYIPIWSNECFELWYILHYEFFAADTGRKSYFSKLNEFLDIEKYEDNKAMDVFSVVHTPERIASALRNAEKLSKEFSNESSYARRIPCTQVFALVRELEKRLKVEFSDIDKNASG